MITIGQAPQNKKMFIKIERVADDILYEVEKAWWEIGKAHQASLKQGLRFGKRGGRIYRHTRSTGVSYTRQSSAKGEYPQRVSGVLRKSVGFTVFSHKQMYFGVGDRAPYAEYLEDQAGEPRRKAGGRLLLTHTVRKLQSETANIMEKRVDEAVKR